MPPASKTAKPKQRKTRTAPPPRAPEEIAGWDIQSWCRAVGIGVSTEKALPPGSRPTAVRIGTRRIVVEEPRAWLQRIAAMGGTKLRSAGQATASRGAA